MGIYRELVACDPAAIEPLKHRVTLWGDFQDSFHHGVAAQRDALHIGRRGVGADYYLLLRPERAQDPSLSDGRGFNVLPESDNPVDREIFGHRVPSTVLAASGDRALPGDPDPVYWAVFGRTIPPFISHEGLEGEPVFPLALNTVEDVSQIVDALKHLDVNAAAQHPEVLRLLDQFGRTDPRDTVVRARDWLMSFYERAAGSGWEVYSYAT